MGAEVVLQTGDDSGDVTSCCSFAGVATDPVRLLVVAEPRLAALRDRLASALDSALSALAGSCTACLGPRLDMAHCRSIGTSRQIMVVVTDAQPGPSGLLVNTTDRWSQLGFELVGVLNVHEPHDQALPPAVQPLHAVSWVADVAEASDDILAAAGVEPERRCVFVSYAHSDGADEAFALFDALVHRRFEVFLDTYALQPGTNFALHIDDELIDKQMVVVVETPGSLRSAWVRSEVSRALVRRHGVVALNRSDAQDPGFRAIPEAHRCRSRDYGIAADFVIRQHREQLLWKHQSLLASAEQALRANGVMFTAVPGGFVTAQPLAAAVRVELRPAALQHFRRLHMAAAGREAVMTHPRPALARKIADVSWLRANIPSLHEYDEGELVDLCADVAAGHLR